MSFRFTICHPTARIDPNKPLWWYNSMVAYFEACERPENVEYILVVHESRYAEYLATTELFTLPRWGSFRVILNQGLNNSNTQGNCAGRAATGHILIGSMDDLF